MELVSQAVAAGQPIMQYTLPQSKVAEPCLPRFLSTVQWLAETPLSEPISLPAGPQGGAGASVSRLVDVAGYCRLLEDVLELGTIRDGEDSFAYMEARLVELLAREASANSPAKLCVLRSCNNLLRRLSKSQDLQLCGRILIFIARIYPLGDKSGVNLHGTVNSGLVLPVDEVAPDDVDSSGEPIDAKLYATFWGLQNVFKNPALALAQSVWGKLVADLGTVLDELDRRKVTVKAGHSFAASAQAQQAGGPAGRAAMAVDGGHAATAAAATSVKYLSSSRLFGLQLRDAGFRRQFLVQCAAALHAVRKLGKNDKVPVGSKFEGADELATRVYAAMSKTEDCGADFAAAVRHVLAHESEWVDWKNAGCPPFDRPPLEPLAAPGPAGASTAAGAETGGSSGAAGPPIKRRRVAGKGGAVAAGGGTAGFLRQISVPADQMAGLTAADRKLMPALREFAVPIIEDMDPESCIDEEYRRLHNNKVFVWKTLRMMARSHLSQLAGFKSVQSTQGGNHAEQVERDIEQAVLNIYPDVRERFEAYKKQQEEQAAAEQAANAAAEPTAGPDGQEAAPERAPEGEAAAAAAEGRDAAMAEAGES